MTEASKPRRKLFKRSEPEHPLTGHKILCLVWLRECGLLTVPQLSRLVDKSLQATRKHLADLYNIGLVDRIGVDRSVLTPIDAPNTPELLGGRAPILYQLTREGAKVIGVRLPADIPNYGPKNSYFLAHTVETIDVRVWLETLKRRYGHDGCTRWETGTAAHIGRTRPDALFMYRFPKNTLVGMVETDRGTERGTDKWESKLASYQALYASTAIAEATGQESGRVIVISPNARRRDTIAEILAAKLPGTGVPATRFWITEKSTLEGVDLLASVWRVPGSSELRPLVRAEIL